MFNFFKKKKNPEFAEAPSAPVIHEIATPARDPSLPVFSNIYNNPDKVLASKGQYQGIKLYDKVFQDGHCRSVINTRITTLVGCEWNIVPPENALLREKNIAKNIESILYNANFDNIREELLKALIYGFYGAEIMWKISNHWITIDKFIAKHPQWFVFDAQRNARLLTAENNWEGIPIPDKKFLILQSDGTDNPYGDPLGAVLYYLLWYKHENMKYSSMFNERFAMPVPCGVYPQGSDPNTITQLNNALKSIQKGAALTYPEGCDIKYLETKNVTNTNYQMFIEYIDREMSKLLLGQSMTTESGPGGSYARDKIGKNMTKDIIQSDADLLDEYLNKTLIRWLCDYNYTITGDRYPKLVTFTEEEPDLAKRAEIDKILVKDINVPIKLEYFAETYGVPLQEEQPMAITTTTTTLPLEVMG